MKFLVVGGGGREHAVVKKLSESGNVDSIICAPGNGGISELAECKNVSATDIEGMVKLAKENNVDFVVVTPDDPLALGMVDAMEAAGIPAFGPNKNAAQIEASKVFAKRLMKKANIPTAASEVFDNPEAAKKYIKEQGAPIVIKADGLAKGKGVIIAETVDEAIEAVDSIMADKVFGNAGLRIIVEEFLEGKELSVMCFCDGEHIVAMPASRDHKRAFDGDTGKNTGGMGAICPVSDYTQELAVEIKNKVLQPAVDMMAKIGCPFKGVLYAGLMLTKKGPYVLEFNARFGDPETQAVLPLMVGDLAEVMIACRNGDLDTVSIDWKKESCAVVVMASGGYPDSYKSGYEITGLDNLPASSWVIHAGTAKKDGKIVTSGGRVLNVCAYGTTVNNALGNAYRAVDKIDFEGAFYRHDIGKRN